jgi:hypothetical protein
MQRYDMENEDSRKPKQQSVQDQIAADVYKKANPKQSQRGLPFRRVRFVPGGNAPQQNAPGFER